MVLLKIEALTTEELRYIAGEEKLDGWQTLAREELIDSIADLYDAMPDETGAAQGPQRIVNCLTDVQMDRMLALPGVEALPAEYMETSIHMIKKDPFWAYVFWSISPIALGQCKDRDPGCRIFLKASVFGAGGKVRDTYDIDVEPADRTWTVTLPWRGCSYRIELVAEYPGSGIYETLAASETIHTSPAIDPKVLDSIRSTMQAPLILSCLCSKNGDMIKNKLVTDLFERLNAPGTAGRAGGV